MEIRNAFSGAWDGWLNQCIIPIKAAKKEDSMDKVIQLMLEQGLAVLPVIDDEGFYCGTINASDVMRWSIAPIYSFIDDINKVPDLSGSVDHFFRYTRNISSTEIMIQNESLIVCSEMSTSQIFFIFAKTGHNNLFVTDSKLKLKGSISKIDFLKIYDQYSGPIHCEENQIEQQTT